MQLDRRRFIGVGAAGLGALWACGAPPTAQTAKPTATFPRHRKHAAQPELLTSDIRSAVDDGLKWLSKQQHRTGTWGMERGAQPSAAITGLVGLALLASGRFKNEIRKGVDWSIKTQDENGEISNGYDVTGIGHSFEHVVATLFLTQAFALDPNSVPKTNVQEAIRYLISSQRSDGGWSAGYSVEFSCLHTTAWAYWALCSARAADLSVERDVVARAVSFAEKRAIKEGGFKGTHGMFYPTTAGLSVMFSQGRGAEDQVVRSAQKVVEHEIGSEYGGSISEWDYVAAVQTTHAFAIENGAFWKRWFSYISEYCTRRQNPDGTWMVEYCFVARGFATALSLLVLQAPLRTLPMWQL